MDGALQVVQEGVEIKLLLRGRDIELHVLLAVDTAEAGLSIEGARASGVVEAELLDLSGNLGVCEHEATESRDSVQRDLVVDLFLTDGDIATAEVGICVARGVGELDLRGVGHRGVATGAMAYDHQEVGALSELEGGLAEIGFGRGLVDLLDAGAAFIVDGEVEAGTGLGGRGTSASSRGSALHRGISPRLEGAEGCLLDTEDRDPEVFVSGKPAVRWLFVGDGLLAGGEGQKCA